jgi:hypothetical protein
MLLEWVLSRDIERVLSMLDAYGGWSVVDGKAAPIQPPTWDDVLCAYTIDETLPKDERGPEAVRRAKMHVIPARQKIYDALRSGAIDGWARPNGKGDTCKIEPVLWAGLQIRAVKGHDIAVPVDSTGEALNPRPLTDYLAGAVPVNTTPTAWPDPVFPAERAISLWRKNPDGQPATPHSEPAQQRRRGPAPTKEKIQIVAKSLFASGLIPPDTITWKAFQVALCKELGVTTSQRGYSLDTIEAAVRPLLPHYLNGEKTESTN